MQLIEGQVCVCVCVFYKNKTNRYKIISIESARVRGSNKDGRDLFLAIS